MSEKFFGRTYKLKIGDREFSGGGGKDALDIRFNVKYHCERQCRFGQVSILGLSWDTMMPFIALTGVDRAKAENQMLNVKLDAGYEQTGMVNIIDGYVYKATITKPPEMWMQMEVSEVLTSGGKITQFNLPFSKDGYTMAMVASSLFEKFGCTFTDLTVNQIGRTKKVNLFNSGFCTLSKAINKIAGLADWNICARGTTIEAYDKNPTKTFKTNIPISSESGLLGVSGISNTNASVTTYIRANEDPRFGFVNLQSKMNPQANGTYKLISRTYTGHFRGKEWYTVYECTGRAQR